MNNEWPVAMVSQQTIQNTRAKITGSRVAAILLMGLLAWLGATTGAAAELPRTGQRSCYDGQGAVIDHAGTGQDGELQAGAVWPDPRFADNGDGTVTDRLTGLMWLQDGGCLGRLSWQGAMQVADGGGTEEQRRSCRGLRVYQDWTLPEIGQLEMLFNAEEAAAAGWLNKHRFKDMRAAGYWSRTTGPNPYRAWSFDFASGAVSLTGKVEENFCLLVRRPVEQKAGGAALPEEEAPGPARFTDNGDGTITDRQSGLMWLKDGECLGNASWQDALQAVHDLNADPKRFACQGLRVDYRDWSLPNRHELLSIVDHGYDLPALAPGYPFAGLSSRYWTSTTAAGRPAQAYYLLLGAGELGTGDKNGMHGVWPVRPATGRPDRRRIADQELAAGVMKDPFLLESIGGSRAVVWPVKRFTDHGDGTLTDNITGLMWLNDGACFLPETWENAGKVIEVLNASPARLKCARYRAAYHDWQLPDITVLRDLLGGAEGEPAAWLNSQGATDIIARDYWVRNSNQLNLYFAWAVNLRQGTPRNYPMSFELHVWPVRLPEAVVPVTAAPAILVNGKEGKVSVKKGEELLLSAAITKVSGAAPASFRIWYTAPDGKSRWLTSQGEWVREEADLYRGNLFVLEDTPVFRGDTTELENGVYSFFFAILPEAGPDGTEPPQPSQAELRVTVTGEADAPPQATVVPAPAASLEPVEEVRPEPAAITEEAITE